MKTSATTCISKEITQNEVVKQTQTEIEKKKRNPVQYNGISNFLTLRALQSKVYLTARHSFVCWSFFC